MNKLRGVVSIVLNSSSLKNNSYQIIRDYTSQCLSTFHDYEILIIKDDRLVDEKNILNSFPNIRVIELVNKVSVERGFMMGLGVSIGDYVVLSDPNFNDFTLILDSINLAKDNEDHYVAGRIQNNRSLFFFIRRFFYRLTLKLSNIQLSSRSTSFRTIPRGLVNSLLASPHDSLHLYAKIDKSGYEVKYVDYESKYYIKDLTYYVKNFFSLLLGNSKVLFRLFSLAGMVFSLLSLTIGFYSILIKIKSDDVVPGWASTISIVTLLFSIQFILFAFFGEFIARSIPAPVSSQIFADIIDERSSKILIYDDQLNVVDQDS